MEAACCVRVGDGRTTISGTDNLLTPKYYAYTTRQRWEGAARNAHTKKTSDVFHVGTLPRKTLVGSVCLLGAWILDQCK